MDGSETNGAEDTDVMLLPNSTAADNQLIGVFVRHEQTMEFAAISADNVIANGSNNSVDNSSSPNKGKYHCIVPTLTSSAASISTTTFSAFQSSTVVVVPVKKIYRYELNRKLFAINEPYLMKTERAAILKDVIAEQQQQQQQAAAATAGATDLPSTIVLPQPPPSQEIENVDSAAKPVTNRAKKRAKTIAKKVNYLEQNLANNEERSLAAKLIDRFLRCCSGSNEATTASIGAASSNGSSSPRLDSGSQERRSKARKDCPKESSSNSSSALTEKKVDPQSILLRHINTTESDSNKEAQAFVQGLFRNRFESLGYQAKVLCNPYSRAIRVKIGLSSYLIPPRCSFAGVDIIQGIQRLIAEVRSNASLIRSVESDRPFFVVMDPAWENKSVKRKRSYETVSNDYLLRMCRELRILLDHIGQTKTGQSNRGGGKKNSRPPIEASVVTAIWTTKLHRSFVVDEMLPVLGMSPCFELKWHKVTNGGCPVKIHGGLEYLIVAQRSADLRSRSPVSPANSPIKKTATSSPSLRRGLLVSVPSAIHSHKPSVLPIFRKLFGEHVLPIESPPSQASLPLSSLDRQIVNDCRVATKGSSMPPSLDDHLLDYALVDGEIISPLIGVELFGRYLQSGFHSIGFECIKLQNEEIFTATEVKMI